MPLISNAHWRLFLFYTTHISFWVYSYISGLVQNWFVTHVYCKPTETWFEYCASLSLLESFSKSQCAFPCPAVLKRPLKGLWPTSIVEKLRWGHPYGILIIVKMFSVFILAKVYLIKTTISWTFWRCWRTSCSGGFGAALCPWINLPANSWNFKMSGWPWGFSH